MKLTTVLLIATIMQVSASSFAQKITLSQENISLKQLFKEIGKQTGYNFLYPGTEVQNTVKVSVNFRNTPLEEALIKALHKQPFTYEIENNTIIIKEKSHSILDRIKTYLASIDVNGKVVDTETGKPLANVNVVLKGSNRSVITSENGLFNFNSLPNDAILVISSVGYEKQELKATSIMYIKLVQSTQKLNDVVISTGYQEIMKASTTGAYSVVTAKDIESNPSINLMERLAGRIPGVVFDVRKNTIQIRGVSSFPSTLIEYSPLIVIDGFPSTDKSFTKISSGDIESSITYRNEPKTSGNAILSYLNPADIESITFLKDAAASAIWGAQAANGVIVITTKRGKKGNTSINAAVTVSTSAPANFKNLTSMSSRDYLDLEQELVNMNFIMDPVVNGYRSLPVSEGMNWMLLAKRSPTAKNMEKRDSAINILANRSNRDQLREYMLQRAVTKQYNLSFSGGGANNSYYFSGNYTKDQPVFKSNFGETYHVISNLNNEFLNKKIVITTGLGSNYSKSQVNGTALQSLGTGPFGFRPYDLLVDENGNKFYKGINLTTQVSDSLTRVKKLLPWTFNPIDELNYNNTINTSYAFRINTAIKGVITNWLYLTLSGQVNKRVNQQVNIQNKNSFVMRDLINTGTNPLMNLSKDLPTAPYGIPNNAIYKSSQIESNDYGLRGQFNIDKSWSDEHKLNLLGGMEIRESTSKGFGQTLYGYDEETSTSVNINTSGTASYYSVFNQRLTYPSTPGTVYRGTRRYLSYFSNVNYSYKDKYFVSGSMRFDDINVIGVSRRDRARPLWSAGLRWDVKKENFMNDISWINDLSLRTTVGTAGNPPAYMGNLTRISIGLIDATTQLQSATISAPANQDISWETTRTINAGLDATFINRRLHLSLDVYNKKTTDILIQLPINPTYGFTSLQYNAGNLAGHGIEFNLAGDIVKRKDWGWVSNFNISFNTNKITDTRFPPTTATVASSAGTTILTTGYPIDNLFVYRWAGLDNTGQSQIYAADGSIIGVTNNTVKPQDRIAVGRSVAPYTGGFSSSIHYKNFSLLAAANFNLGHKFLLQTINGGSYPTTGSVEGLISNSIALAKRWRKPGDEAFTDIPGITGKSINNISRFLSSDYNVRNAGYVRLQQISLNYRLSSNLLKSTPFIKAVNLGATVSNLGLLWVANKEGIDPEYQMTNSFTNLPPSSSYVINLNISL